MSFEFIKCTAGEYTIEGLYEIKPEIRGDVRGSFLETYNQKSFFDAGLTMNFVQDNQSKSYKNVIRGMHFQKHFPQGKLIRTLEGKVYDVVVDLRKGSATFGKYYGIVLDSEKQNMFYIPEGFAHGFAVLSDSAVISYKCSDFYHPEDESGLMWNDSEIGINWEKVLPGISEKVILSDKDKKYPAFNKNSDYFDLNGKWISE